MGTDLVRRAVMSASQPRGSGRRRFDLEFRPRSYWPAGHARGGTQDEVELVRITLATPCCDVISLKARRAGRGRIVYRMVHEDMDGPTRQRIRVQPASSTRPLTFGKIVDLLESACYAGRCEEGDERFRGVIWGTLQLHLEHGCEPADDYFFMLEVSSPLYPQLARYFGQRLDEWCLANCVEEEDCGEVVRLRRGPFARKLLPA